MEYQNRHVAKVLILLYIFFIACFMCTFCSYILYIHIKYIILITIIVIGCNNPHSFIIIISLILLPLLFHSLYHSQWFLSLSLSLFPSHSPPIAVSLFPNRSLRPSSSAESSSLIFLRLKVKVGRGCLTKFPYKRRNLPPP